MILPSVSVSRSCMQGKGQGQADAQTETAQVAKEQRSADGLRLMSMLSEQDQRTVPCLDKPDEEAYCRAGEKYGYKDFQLYIPNDKLEKGEDNYRDCTIEVMKMIRKKH